jgi:hypothetical protein
MFETGYGGFLVITMLLISPALMAARNYLRLRGEDRYLCAVFLSSLVSFYVVMISVAVYAWGQNGFMLWMVVSMTVSYVMLKKQERLGAQRAVPDSPEELTAAPSRELWSASPVSSWAERWNNV